MASSTSLAMESQLENGDIQQAFTVVMVNSTSLVIENHPHLEDSNICCSDVYDDESNSEIRSRKNRKPKLQVPKSLKRELMPPTTIKELKQFILVHFPILSWLWSYQPKFLIGDITAGITVSVMHIPQGMAYAALAELPPVYGLYTSFMAPLIYAVFGTSRHVSVGILAVASLMVGDTVRRTIDANPSLCMANLMGEDSDNATNDTEYTAGQQIDYPDCPASVDIAITMTFVYAMFMLLFGLLRLGFMTTFLSEPLISGYTTATAVIVITSQLRHIVGVPYSAIRVDPGVFALQRTWVKLMVEVVSGRLNWATVIISAICIIFLVLVRMINAGLWKFHCYKKLPIPIPSQLIAVIVATVISTLMKFDDKYDIDILGELPTGFPPLSTPKASYIGDVITDAFVAVVICYSVTLSIEKLLAKKHGYTIYPNQEFFAFGMMNGIGSFFSCYIASATLSRCILQDVTGGKTQAVAFVSSSILLIVLLVLGPLFEYLPRAILSAIIIVALQRMLMKAQDIKKYYQLSIPDMFTWIVVFLATVLLGVGLGLAVGIGFAMLLIVLRTVMPVSLSLGKNDDSCSYTEDGKKIPGVLIFRFIAPLCFTNAQLFMSKLAAACNADAEKWNSLSNSQPGCIEVAYYKLIMNCCMKNQENEVIQLESQPTFTAIEYELDDSFNMHDDCNNKSKGHKAKKEVTQLESQLTCITNGCVHDDSFGTQSNCSGNPEGQNNNEFEVLQLDSQTICIANINVHHNNLDMQTSSIEKAEEQGKTESEVESQPTSITSGYGEDENFSTEGNSNKISEEQNASGNQDQSHWNADLQYIIIDMAPVTFIDSSGSKMLERVRSDYSSHGIQLVLAATSRHNMETLEYSGFAASLGAQWFLPSIQAAVDFIEKQQSV